ncbi:MAG: DUF3365 domain-containing protein [Betaproteobacteria bacterium]|nr:DUF3365 domain-containing protein [Betaproteobacteria bacterium]
MRMTAFVLAVSTALWLPAVVRADGEQDGAVAEARALTSQLARELGGALKKEMAASGPEGAIGVCRQMAPEIAGNLSRQTGSRVARVSLRARNPMLGQPDAFEQSVLAEFDRRAAAGEKPDALEHVEVVSEPAGRYLRYMKAIPVQPLCLACHGTPETIPDSVRQKLAAEYPKDHAVGYTPGQIRGAFTVKKPF